MRRAVALLLMGILLAGCSDPLNPGVGQGAEQKLYQQTLSVVQAQRDWAAAHGGRYSPTMFNLVAMDPALAPLVSAFSGEVNTFTVSSNDRAYQIQLVNQSAGGAAMFDVIVPFSGQAVTTCQGVAPLCTNGSFHLDADNYRLPSPHSKSKPKSTNHHHASRGH